MKKRKEIEERKRKLRAAKNTFKFKKRKMYSNIEIIIFKTTIMIIIESKMKRKSKKITSS